MSARPMRDSGVEWIGEIPAHWEIRRSKTLFFRVKREPDNTSGIITAFRDGEVTLRSNRREEGFTFASKEFGYQQIHPNDLVIHGMDAFAGSIGVSDSYGKSTPVYLVCLPLDESTIHTTYFAVALRTMALSGFITSLAKGIRERSTSFGWVDFSLCQLPLPPLPEQRAIATFLGRKTSQIDQIIEKKERLIKLLEEKRSALITQAVTRGLDPEVPMRDSGVEWIGEIPEHWEWYRLKTLTPSLPNMIQTGPFGAQLHSSDYGDEGTPLILIKHINGKSLTHVDLPLIPDYKAKTLSGAYRVKFKDLVFSRVGSVGRVSIIQKNEENWLISGQLLLVRIDHYRSAIDFIYWSITSSLTNHIVKIRTLGTTRDSINTEILRDLPILLPPLPEQRAIATFLDRKTSQIDQIIAKSKTQIEKLKEYRQALITSAVTGKIDLSEQSAPPTATTSEQLSLF